jgi:hypothetical protein
MTFFVLTSQAVSSEPAQPDSTRRDFQIFRSHAGHGRAVPDSGNRNRSRGRAAIIRIILCFSRSCKKRKI